MRRFRKKKQRVSGYKYAQPRRFFGDGDGAGCDSSDIDNLDDWMVGATNQGKES